METDKSSRSAAIRSFYREPAASASSIRARLNWSDCHPEGPAPLERRLAPKRPSNPKGFAGAGQEGTLFRVFPIFLSTSARFRVCYFTIRNPIPRAGPFGLALVTYRLAEGLSAWEGSHELIFVIDR